MNDFDDFLFANGSRKTRFFSCCRLRTIYMKSAHLIHSMNFTERAQKTEQKRYQTREIEHTHTKIRKTLVCKHLNRQHLWETWLDWKESISFSITCVGGWLWYHIEWKRVTGCAMRSFSHSPISFITHRLFIVCVFVFSPVRNNCEGWEHFAGISLSLSFYLFYRAHSYGSMGGLSTRIHFDLNYSNPEMFRMWLFSDFVEAPHAKTHIEKLTFRCGNWLSNEMTYTHR